MKKVIDCYTDNNPVINKKLREVTVDEGTKIASELFRILNERKDGIGLAANQVVKVSFNSSLSGGVTGGVGDGTAL